MVTSLFFPTSVRERLNWQPSQGQRCLDSDLEDLQMKVKRPLLLGR